MAVLKTRILPGLCSLLLATATATVCAQPAPASQALPALKADIAQAIAKLAQQPALRQALQLIEKNEAQTLADTLAINAIPAPTFEEGQRALNYAERMKAVGLQDVHVDEVGNVLGLYRGSGAGPTVVLAAHLDTVYPMATDLTLQQKDGRYYAPGIADNGRSLAAMLSIVKAMRASAIVPAGDILVCANVGEEGLGDLRGVKHLFKQHKEIKAFIGLEPAGNADAPITYLATGSRRYKITFSGTGGHSYAAFGLPSAIHAMGRAIAHIDDLRVPSEPKVTFNVGIVNGGQTVNTISAEASMLVDMRSEDAAQLAKVEQQVLAAVRQGVAETNQRWNSKSITVEAVLIGERPAGKTALDSVIVQAALSAAQAMGRTPLLAGAQSTDANLPISLGIPAITMSGGGSAGGAHSAKTEWWAPVRAYEALQNVMLTLLGLSGVQGVAPPLLTDQP